MIKFLLGAALVLPILAQTQVPNTWLTLDKADYRISYPPEWSLQDPGSINALFFLFSPLQDGTDKFRDNVNLMVEPLDSSMVWDSLLQQSLEQIKMLITNVQIISDNPQERDGMLWHRRVYTGQVGIFELQFEQHYWLAGDRLFVLTLTAETKSPPALHELGRQVLGTFALKTP